MALELELLTELALGSEIKWGFCACSSTDELRHNENQKAPILFPLIKKCPAHLMIFFVSQRLDHLLPSQHALHTTGQAGRKSSEKRGANADTMIITCSSQLRRWFASRLVNRSAAINGDATAMQHKRTCCEVLVYAL